MHSDSLDLMRSALDRLKLASASVLDVGSYDINGTYRPLVEQRGYTYTGLDIRKGINVDIVSDNPYKYPIKPNTYDAVICGNMLHNVQAPWKLIPEMVRVLKPGGLLAIVAPTYGRDRAINAYPVDCWRFMPDGLTYLFDETKKLDNYLIKIYEGCIDIVASAFKAGGESE
jgi:SAM-dependent methyltransferase